MGSAGASVRCPWRLWGCTSWFGALFCQNVTLHKKKVFSLRENAKQGRKVRAVACTPQ